MAKGRVDAAAPRRRVRFASQVTSDARPALAARAFCERESRPTRGLTAGSLRPTRRDMCPPPADKSEALGLCSGPSAGCRGIAADIRRRRPWYKSDWLDGWNAKTTASIFYMFFTSIAPAITFAELLDSATHGKIGVVEVCLSSCVSGLIFSVFAGQPLVIVGVTGPVTILTITIYQMADALNIKFLYFYSWAQIFAGLMHMAVAALGWCDYIKYITNFSCHTFGLLIATIYAVVGWTSVVKYTDSRAAILPVDPGFAMSLREDDASRPTPQKSARTGSRRARAPAQVLHAVHAVRGRAAPDHHRHGRRPRRDVFVRRRRARAGKVSATTATLKLPPR